MRDFSCKNQGREPGRPKKNAKIKNENYQFNFAPFHMSYVSNHEEYWLIDAKHALAYTTNSTARTDLSRKCRETSINPFFAILI
jgi:prophage antirepressor-like protein